MTLTFGSLFAGIGGLDLGLERAGMECRWQVEIDPYCAQVLAKHWPGVQRYGDIRTLTGDELEPVDLICGGFPCQDLSQAGKRAGIEGSRSGLWSEFARLVGRLGPRWVLIENVPGLLVHGAMRRVVGDLAGLGYVGCWRSLRAAEFGASHLRKRVFLVAYGAAEGWSQGRTEPTGIKRGLDASVNDRELAVADRTRRAPSGFGCDQHTGGESEAGCRTVADAAILPDACSAGLPHAEPANLPEPERHAEGRTTAEFCGAPLRFAPGPADDRWPAILRDRPDLAPALESAVRGVADGVPDWLDRAMGNRTKRLGRLGNAVVPDCAEWVGRQILEFERRNADEHG